MERFSFYSLDRLGDLYTNFNIMRTLATQPDTFYTNSLKYVSFDYIKNVYFCFKGNRYYCNPYSLYFLFLKKYLLNYAYNRLSEDIIKNYLTNFKEVLKKYGYKF